MKPKRTKSSKPKINYNIIIITRNFIMNLKNGSNKNIESRRVREETLTRKGSFKRYLLYLIQDGKLKLLYKTI